MRYRPPDLESALAVLTDPRTARRTLHWGRNYVYLAELETADGPLQVVVKQFRNDDLRARLQRRYRGSKAERSWRAARAMSEAGISTPDPVIWIESVAAAGPSFFVTRHVDGVFELRQLFRAIEAGRERELLPTIDPRMLLSEVGRTVRRLHDAGFLHRDLSMGNLLVEDRGDGSPKERFRIHVVDLNRARRCRRPGILRRLRELSRLPVGGGGLRRALLGGYGGPSLATSDVAWALLAAQQRAFLWKVVWKARLRRLSKRAADLVRSRRPHPHIPPPAAGAPRRERSVWDELSDQPHQHAGRLAKAAVRLADSGTHLRALAAAAAAAPRIWRRYRQLRRSLHASPAPLAGCGVGLRPWPEAPEALLEAVEQLGVGPLLVRLHPWEADHAEEERLARELAARGHELTFALPQTRELVRDRPRWRAKVDELGERFLPYGNRFQLGQAINRSKWGVWTYQEYADLAAEAAAILRRKGEVELLGPAVIDFELHATAAVLNLKGLGLEFDVVSSLLYVDRRGAPERTQLGFDTVDKVVLLKAIADTARNATGRCWITEVNWPLAEGPHAPAGRAVAVDEERQADYLARYYLLALGSGCVERVFWWQLVARGYGLVDPAGGELRRRPSFRALRALARLTRDGRATAPLPAPPGVHLLPIAWRGEEERLLVAWCDRGEARLELTAPPAGACDRDGEPLPAPGRRLTVGGSPLYLRFRGELPGIVTAA